MKIMRVLTAITSLTNSRINMGSPIQTFVEGKSRRSIQVMLLAETLLIGSPVVGGRKHILKG
jgi:hypothetical protein